MDVGRKCPAWFWPPWKRLHEMQGNSLSLTLIHLLNATWASLSHALRSLSLIAARALRISAFFSFFSLFSFFCRLIRFNSIAQLQSQTACSGLACMNSTLQTLHFLDLLPFILPWNAILLGTGYAVRTDLAGYLAPLVKLGCPERRVTIVFCSPALHTILGHAGFSSKLFHPMFLA